MISKIVSARSFYHACRYICTKQGAEVLLAEGVRSHSYQLMAEDFTRQQGMRPSKKRACFHGILSFYPGEKPSNEQMTEIAKKYLQRLGLVNTQYTVCRHSDRAHLHLHLLANLVDNKGKTISETYLWPRSNEIARGLTKEYHLTPGLEKNLKLTHLENLNKMDANRYKIYAGILESLPHCRSLEELEMKLLGLGIRTRYKFRGGTTEKQGISFKLGNYCFKGSKVDRRFSLPNLQKSLALNQGILLERGTINESHFLHRTSIPSGQEAQTHPKEQPEKLLGEGTKEVLSSLLRPENSCEPVPKELLKNEHSRKKKMSRGLRW